MANELNIQLNPFTENGLTLLGKVYNLSGTQQGSDVSMTEPVNGFYTGTFDVSTLADGEYTVIFQTTTVFYGSGTLPVKGGVEIKLPDTIFDEIIEGTETFKQQMRLVRAEAAGKLQVAGNNVIIRDAQDTKDRIDAIVDRTGQRTSVTTDAT